MKFTNLIKNIFFIVLLLLIASCSTDDIEKPFAPTLPKITQTGENTFGCYIDVANY